MLCGAFQRVGYAFGVQNLNVLINRRSFSAMLGAGLVGATLTACGANEPPSSASPGASEVAEAPSASPSAPGSPSPSASASASPRPSIKPDTSLDAITVTEAGGKPQVKVPAPWAIDKTRTKVLKPGGDQKVLDSGYVNVHYLGVNGRTGKVFDENYGAAPATMLLPDRAIAGFAKGLIGQAVGSRVLIAMPSTDGYDSSGGQANAGIEVGDTLIFVVDIVAAAFDEATGTAQNPPADLPVVKMTDKGPEVQIPATGSAPTELKKFALIKGAGAPIKAEDAVIVRYRSVVWATGQTYEDAWTTPQVGELKDVIQGWQQGLVGQSVGSRVLLVIPPALAYPNGNAKPKLDKGQTLVYVIDVLYAANS